MSATVGELFINLGIKGGETAFKGLTSIKNALTDMSAQGIAAKAAILGAVYAVDQFTSQSAAYGNNLQNFSTLTGISVEKTQQLAEAIRETTNVSRSQGTSLAQGFLLNFQEKLAAWRMKGTPMGEFAAQFSGIAGFDLNDSDPFHFFSAIQRFVRDKRLSIGQQNAILAGMGVDPNIIITARKFAGDILQIRKNIESQHLIDALTATEGQRNSFFTNLEIFKDLMTGKYGISIWKGLNEDLTLIQRFENELDKLGKQFPKLASIVKTAMIPLGIIIAEAFGPLTLLSTAIVSLLAIGSQWEEHAEGEKDNFFGDKDFKGGTLEKWKDWLFDKEGAVKMQKEMMQNYLHPSITPKVGPKSDSTKSDHASVNVHVNQYGIPNTHDSIEQMQRETRLAYYTFATTGQVT